MKNPRQNQSVKRYRDPSHVRAVQGLSPFQPLMPSRFPVRWVAQVGWVAIALLTLDATPVAADTASAPEASSLEVSSSPLPPISERSPALSDQQPNLATTLLFVNPAVGNDGLGDGSQRSPWKTLTHALEQAQPGMVIMLSAGTYSTESGEQFPIVLRDGVTLQGDPGNQGAGVLIRGGGEYLSPTVASQNVAIVAADDATLTGITVRNLSARGYGLWIESSNIQVMHNTFSQNRHDGISVTGESRPLIQGNLFHRNGASGISIFGSGQADIRDNRLEATGFGINVGQYAAPRIINNQILNNRDGVVVQGQSRPLLRDNLIEGSQRDGLVAIAHAVPDLGRADSPGYNQFRRNGRHDLNTAETRHSVPAFGNDLAQANTTGRLDLTGTATIPAPPPVSLERGHALLAESRTTAPAQPMAQQPLPLPSRAESTPTPAPASTPTVAPVAPPAPIARPQVERSPAQGAAASRNLAADAPMAAAQEIAVIPARTSPPASAIAFPRPTDLRAAQGAGRGDRSTPIPSIAEFLPPPPVAPAVASPSATPPVTTPVTTTPVTIPVTPARSSQAAIRPASAQPPRTRANITAPIEIPVPPPVSYAAAPSAIPSPARQPTLSATSRSSAPTSQASPQATTRSRNLLQALVPAPADRAATPTVPRSNVLPVPTGSIPAGHVGSLPTVSVYSDPLRRPATATSAPSQPNRSAALGLRYRVIVDAPNERSQTQVRSLIPGAFSTLVNGYRVMQAGAFSTLANANEAAQMLSQYGFRVAVQPIE